MDLIQLDLRNVEKIHVSLSHQYLHFLKCILQLCPLTVCVCVCVCVCV